MQRVCERKLRWVRINEKDGTVRKRKRRNNECWKEEKGRRHKRRGKEARKKKE